MTELLERTTDGFFTVNKDWELTYANPITKNFMALAGHAILAKTMTELFTSPDREKFMKHYEAVARTGVSEQFEETDEGRS